MILQENDLEFNFTDALGAIKFDDTAHALSHCMKAVDFIVDLSGALLFVEVKDPAHPRAQPANAQTFAQTASNGDLKKEIVMKFRDTFIYRWAEEKLDKPIHYVSLITLEEPLLSVFEEDLRRHLPVAGPARWAKQITVSCHAVTIDAWNRNFPKWPVRRISAGTVV